MEGKTCVDILVEFLFNSIKEIINWAPTKQQEKKLDGYNTRILRTVLNKPLKQNTAKQ